jgi:D-alanyl-D-alanine carboxypeptidase
VRRRGRSERGLSGRVLGAAFAFILLVGQLAIGALPVAGADAGNRAADLGPALQSVIDQQRQALNIPGVAATVIFGDGSRWSGVSGKQSLSSSAAVTAGTPFVVGSITKTFVAALILKLAQEGKLNIDDPLSNWLPDYPDAPDITLRQLLSHTAGTFDYFRHRDYNSAVFGDPSHSWTPQEILSRFAHDLVFEPGTDYRYSNTDFVLLGLVAEAAGGASVGELLGDRFFGPLGLDDTYIQSAGPPPASAARGYLWAKDHFRDVGDASGYRPTRSAATVAWSVGDVVATADDIATWTNALYGGDVLSDASLAAMTDWSRYPGGGDYGLGTRMQEYAGKRMFGHTGSIRGYVAAAWHVPSEDATVVVLTNRGRTNAHVDIPNALMDVMFVDTQAPTVPAHLAAVPHSHRYVQLSWDAATDDRSGTIAYRLFRNGVAVGPRTTLLGLTDRPASVGTFQYQVRAIDMAGNKSAKSPPVSVTVFR